MNANSEPISYEALSTREREVVLLAASGISNKEIASKLSVAEGTVKLHLHHVYRKLGIRSRFMLAVAARNFPSAWVPSGTQRSLRARKRKGR